jgi:hypothetical protein
MIQNLTLLNHKIKYGNMTEQTAKLTTHSTKISPFESALLEFLNARPIEENHKRQDDRIFQAARVQHQLTVVCCT